MKKSNLILSAAVAAAFGFGSFGAHATTVTTATATQTYASELFNGTTPNSVVLTLPTLNIVAGTPLTAGAYVLYVQVSGAAYTNSPALVPAVASTVATITSAATTVTTGSTYSIAVGSATANVLATTFTVAAGQQITAGTVIGTIVGTSIANAGTALGAATPTPVTVTGTITNNNVNQPAASAITFSISSGNIADATSSAVNVATAAAGISSTTAAATSAGQIDLAASSGSATKFTAAATTTQVQLGTVKFTNGSAQSAANTAYAIVTGDRLGATVTAAAGFFAPMGTSGKLFMVSSGSTCSTASTAAISASTAFTTTALAAAATSVTVSGSADVTSATTYHLCMSVNGTTAIVPGTASATFTLTKAAGTAVDSTNTTSAQTLYPLAYNAQVIDVINYVPANVGGGWQQYLRVVNTGSVDAAISAAIIDQTTGTVGTSTAIPAAGTLKAGAAMTLTSQDVEAAVGTIAATARPRIRITAPTNGLQVQNMLFTPNGGFTNNSSTQ
jgi:hypothetical protein